MINSTSSIGLKPHAHFIGRPSAEGFEEFAAQNFQSVIATTDLTYVGFK